ncbi:MAG TPA: hypothetical protein VF544_17085 [Pyrinomonadaceae bacterium]
MKRMLLALLCLLLPAQAALAQRGENRNSKPPADARVRAALDKIGYKYELNAANDYKLVPIETERAGTKADGTPVFRTQLVYVNSNTERYGTLEIREVLAPVMIVPGPLPADVANRLLRENNQVKLGAWRLVAITTGPNAGKSLAMFAAQINADADPESLRLTIKSVILIADRMEKELTGTDDF